MKTIIGTVFFLMTFSALAQQSPEDWEQSCIEANAFVSCETADQSEKLCLTKNDVWNMDAAYTAIRMGNTNLYFKQDDVIREGSDGLSLELVENGIIGRIGASISSIEYHAQEKILVETYKPGHSGIGGILSGVPGGFSGTPITHQYSCR